MRSLRGCALIVGIVIFATIFVIIPRTSFAMEAGLDAPASDTASYSILSIVVSDARQAIADFFSWFESIAPYASQTQPAAVQSSQQPATALAPQRAPVHMSLSAGLQGAIVPSIASSAPSISVASPGGPTIPNVFAIQDALGELSSRVEGLSQLIRAQASALPDLAFENQVGLIRSVISSQGYSANASPPLGGGASNTIAAGNAIDQLNNTTINSPTIIGGSLSNISISGATLSNTLLGSASSTSFFATMAQFATAAASTFSASTASIAGLTATNATTTNLLAIGTTTLGAVNLSNANCSTFSNGGKLTTDASGAIICAGDQGGNGVSVAGANTQIQFNGFGGFSGSASFTFATSTNTFSVPNASTTNLSVSGNATIFAATTTRFAITALASTLLKTSASGSVIPAIAGTDYVASTAGDWTGTFGGLAASYYTDARNLVNFTAPFSAALHSTSTDALSEGVANLYFTNARAQGAIAISGAPLSYSSGVIGISQANASTNGYLTAANWATFNGKLGSSSVASLSANYDLFWNGSAFVGGALYDTGISIGIGTTSPATALAVNGGGYFTGALSLGSALSIANGGTGTTSATGILSNIQFLQSGTAAVARLLQSKLSDTISVKDFGAIGDGVTNDTAAINAAFAAGAGRSVYIPAGTYLVTGVTVPSAILVYGEGTSSILRLANNSNAKVLSNITGSNGIRLENFAIDGNKTNQAAGSSSRGIYLFNASNVLIKSMYIHDTEDHCIHISNTGTQTGNIIQGNQIANCGLNGTSIGGSGIAVTDGIGEVISDNYVSGAYRAGIRPNGTGQVITGNTVYNNGEGGIVPSSAGVGANNITITGNTVFDNQDPADAAPTQSSGVRLTGTQTFTVTGNNIWGNGASGIDVLNGATNGVISGNTCYDNGQSGTGSGIRIFSTGSAPNHIQITGNDCYDDQSTKTQQYGLSIENNATNINYAANMLHDDLTSNLNITTSGTDIAGTNEMATDTLSWFTNGLEQARLTSTGFGLGTTSPMSQFVLQKTGGTTLTLGNGTQVSTMSINSGGALTFNNSAGNSYIFQQAGTSRLTVGGGGNIGIGTSTPGSLLSLNAVANFSVATSTFYSSGGINLTAGCFAIAGTCLSYGSMTGVVPVLSGGTGSTTPFGILVGDGAGNLNSLSVGAGLLLAGTTLTAPLGANYFTNSGAQTYLSTGSYFGIGTSSPYANLSINALSGATNTTLLAVASSTSNSTTTLLVLTNAGFLGLNTAAPTALLDLKSSSIGVAGGLKIDQNSGLYRIIDLYEISSGEGPCLSLTSLPKT